MFFDMIPSGTCSRLAIGLIVLVPVIAYNETGAITVLFSVLIATICAISSAFCKSSLNHVQLPYLRATHKWDFFILFLSVWLDILTLICACGALTRTLSICLDAMTGGMARIYILGRNAPENEPWPDVIGFTIIFMLSVMFMLGLENSKVFSAIMLSSLCGVIGIFLAMTVIRGNFKLWQSKHWLPKGFTGLVSSSALLVFAYPSEVPATGSCKRLKGAIICVFICFAIMLCTGCLTAVVEFSPPDEFIAAPIFPILEKLDFHNFEPIIACLFVLICSCAFIELFSEMFQLIVKLTTSEWKILSRQIGYEHGDSGSPVLAVFIGGSVCAMIAFACPMEIMIQFIAGSQLFSGLLRTFYLFYSPFRPKYMMNNKNNTSLGYSQLKPQVAPMKKSVSTSAFQSNSNVSTAGRILRCLSKPSIAAAIPRPKSRTKKKKNEEMEREWLLLGEPTSPRNTIVLEDEQDTSSLTIPAAPIAASEDIEAVATPPTEIQQSTTESDSSTDIDAVFDEYRQKIEFTTSGPSEKVIRIPSIESWRLSIVLMSFYFVSVLLSIVGFIFQSLVVFGSSIFVVAFFTLILLFVPRYSHSEVSPNVILCSSAIFLQSILLGSTISISLPAIIAWIIAGVLIFTRCDTWFSICIEQPIYINHITAPSTSAAHKSMVRLPRAPKGSIVSSRVHRHGQCR